MPKRALAGASKRSGSKRISGNSSRRIPNTPRRIGGFVSGVPRQSTSAGFRDAHRQQVRDVHGRFAGGWGFAWIGMAAAADELEQFTDHVHSSVEQAAERLAEEMVTYAKENASWTDHPGVHEDARDNLQSEVAWTDSEHFSIMLGHGKDVYYGIWLEVRWGGRYAILLPTIEIFAPQLGARVVALV